MDSYKSYYKGKSILITGGAGAIGCNLTKALSELGGRRIIPNSQYVGYKGNT